MKSISVVDMKGKAAGKLTIDEDYFDVKIKNSLLTQAILMYLQNTRSGCASTKTRGQIRGGGRKPWRQKGTGRARTGSIRNPIWRGGGTIFGPQPRDFRYELPKKIRNLALKQSLNAKLKENQLVVVDQISLPEVKTKQFSKFLQALKVGEKTLVVLEGYDAKIRRASKNIPYANLKTFNNVNAHDVLRHKRVIFTKQALENLIKLRKK